MTFKLMEIDWNAISAISTFLAVLVALFYQPYINRRKIAVDTNLKTDEDNIHLIYLSITNRGEKPIWIVSGGILFEDGEKRVAKFLHGQNMPKKLEPAEVMVCPVPVLEYNFKIKDIFAKDSLGKFWYVRGRKRREFDRYIQICKDHNPPLILKRPVEYMEKPKPKPKPKPKSEC